MGGQANCASSEIQTFHDDSDNAQLTIFNRGNEPTEEQSWVVDRKFIVF